MKADKSSNERVYSLLELDRGLLLGIDGYTQVVEARNRRMIFVSGQVAVNREGELIGHGDLAEQTRQVFEMVGKVGG